MRPPPANVRYPRPKQRQQDGFVLIVGLLLLVVLTILGVSAMRGTTLQERMAGNMQNRAIAFQAAEAALRAGETMLNTPPLPVFKDPDSGSDSKDPDSGSDSVATPYYEVRLDASEEAPTPRWQTLYGINAGEPEKNSVVTCSSTSCPGIGNASASFFIEKLDQVILPGNSLNVKHGSSRFYVYRITAEGISPDQETSVVLQSTVIR